MALRKLESFGWLTGNEGTWVPKRWSQVFTAGSFGLGTPGRRSGSYYLSVAASAMDGLRQNLDNQQTWIVHCACRLTQSNAVIVYADAGTGQVSLYYDVGLQKLVVYRGNATTLLQETANGSVLQNTWHHIIFKSVIDNSAGSYEVRLNGATVLSGTNVDTQITANAYANQVCLSSQNFHDIVILDGTGSAPYNNIIGDMAVYCVLPNGAGAVSGWTPSAGSNYQNVDDTTPDSDTTYNSTSTAGATDRYALPTPTLVGSCRGVSVAAVVRKDDASARTARLKLFDGTTLQSDTTQNLPDSYVVWEKPYQVNPTSGTHWTAAELAAAEVGIELVS